MLVPNARLEVMLTIEKKIEVVIEKHLLEVEKSWQPSDLLPDSRHPQFLEQVQEIQELAKELPHDFWIVLIGDTITEEALPTYEAWLMDLEGVDQENASAWTRWIRRWTAEENRHGSLLRDYLYLSGKVDMKEVEISTQHLISDGFDIGTSKDPYKNFIYTSFQEMATNISHRRVASLAKSKNNHSLAKMCATIASDEARHARAYKEFVRYVFDIDPSEMMLAFEVMMRKKIVMPAHFMRQSGEDIGEVFNHFSDAAQRLNVYTSEDYVDIIDTLLIEWDIDKITDLNDRAERARDYLMGLPRRLRRVSERLVVPEKSGDFRWFSS